MKLRKVDIAKTKPDSQGGYDLLVDMNQVGLSEGETPATEIHIAGTKFFQAGLCDDGGKHYWSYWNDAQPAVNLQLWFSENEEQQCK